MQLSHTMSAEDFRNLCLYNAESHAILNALEATQGKADLKGMKLFPCVVPDRGVSDETMQAALAMLNDLVERSRSKKKPWWKFW